MDSSERECTQKIFKDNISWNPRKFFNKNVYFFSKKKPDGEHQALIISIKFFFLNNVLSALFGSEYFLI